MKQITYIKYQTFSPSFPNKTVTQSIKKCMSTLSASENIFNESASYNEEKLKYSGYKEQLIYQLQTEEKHIRKQKQNTIWFNPPNSRSVKIFGRHFLRLLHEHFTLYFCKLSIRACQT